MKTFELWLSVNDGEYYSAIKMYGESCVIGEPIEEEFNTWYPIYLDGKRIDFDEPINFEIESEEE